ncbi:hypothetical protein L6164_008397 [Bauhinia variegata]|uniref:Uncharacterized protein n=1 Tax=Bauhinia variegata TaxID=167791 RepID=A0ACB9PJF0_BAUVA|nr:hypothetical protein L6164_008397 [Bauhinia variegata]
MSLGTVDDVDRLFACFKCGVSPPQSAVRERKRAKTRIKKESTTHQISPHSGHLSPGSSGQGQNTSATSNITPTTQATDVQLSIQKLGSAVMKAKNFSCGKRISPVVFYGSPHGVPPKRPARLWRLLHEIRLDLSEQNKLNLRKEVWATFPRQDEAIKFAKGHEDLHVFSYQDHFNGQRRFLVSSYMEFWRRYKTMDPKFRHHYEVIQEGLPCHLYFDLEFNKRLNVGKDGDEMVDTLISVILEALHEKYLIIGNQDWMVELDSSTEEKFSRHLIIRIPKTAFKDNSHAGAFVSEICSRVLNSKEKDGRYEKLFIRKDSSSNESASQLFVDTAVYTRNRCFRLHLSSKAGKSSVLLQTGRFNCKDMGEEDMFMASLICKMDVDCQKLLVCKADLDCIKTLHYDTEVNYNVGNYLQFPPELTSDTCTSDVSTTYLIGKSPFPSLDRFVESIASIGNISGKIRSWYWFSDYGVMIYSMSKNRYCERIGRQHKSNHVIYVVDLRRAVYYQKCHDPDCRGYRSPLRPIPIELIPNLSPLYATLGMENHELVDDGFGHQHISGNEEKDFSFYEDDIADCSKDSWWLEAVKVVENIENNQKKPDPNIMEVIDDEDEEWWLAVERSASQLVNVLPS